MKRDKYECPHCGHKHVNTAVLFDKGMYHCNKCATKWSESMSYETTLAKKHPLLNPDSKHYSMVDGVEAITRMEEMYPQDELATWAKITAMKYRLRIGNKDAPSKEMEKIRTYEAYYEYLTAQRSTPDDRLRTVDTLKAHLHTCKCSPCMLQNKIDNMLIDTKRNYQMEKVLNDPTKTSKESHKEAVKEAIKALFGDSFRRAKVREDSEFSKSCKSAKSNAGGNPKIRIVRYIQGSLLNELIGESDSNKLPSNEEPFKVTEVQSDSNRRSSPMDRRVSEDVSAMERFESAYAELSRDFQLGNIDARDFREFISHAFSEFTESVGKI